MILSNNRSLSNRKNRSLSGGIVPTKHIWLRPPLNKSLTTLDRHNGRIKIFEVSASDVTAKDAEEIIRKTFEGGDKFSKLVIYGTDDSTEWKKADFRLEGKIGGFFADGSHAYIWSRFKDNRGAADTDGEAEKILEIARSKQGVPDNTILPGEYSIRIAGANDAEIIASLMSEVFPSYPTDISSESIAQSIQRKVAVYALVEHEGKTVTIVSAELDLGRKNAELSDCVTHPDHRGNGLMVTAITRLMNYINSVYGISNFYSMARAEVAGINVALAKSGFEYDGCLVNNCQMPNGLESMNIWWRTIERSS